MEKINEPTKKLKLKKVTKDDAITPVQETPAKKLKKKKTLAKEKEVQSTDSTKLKKKKKAKETKEETPAKKLKTPTKENKPKEKTTSSREVKYIYPADIQDDALAKKKFRQVARKKLRDLKIKVDRYADTDDKAAYKKALSEYDEYRNSILKPEND